LRADLPQYLQDSQEPSGLFVAEVFRRAVELAEPALPRLRWVNSLPLAEGSPGFEAVRYLAERQLLPGSWQPDVIDLSTWQQMIASFMAWYRLQPYPVRSPDSREVVLEDLSRVLERVAEAVRPAALVASDPTDRSRVSFWAIIWNWTVFPRLIVVRPLVEVTLQQGVAPVLPLLGNCVIRLRDYVLAPEKSAKRLFLANNDSRMIIASSQPVKGEWPRLVEQGQELGYFAFENPEVADVDLYAAVFDGPAAGVGTILSLLPRVRTNMTPNRFFYHMQIPQ